uniref:Uncharacterized protein n=1 Tax=Arundo donax TaxID=35708 RepID=A0A0A9BWV8_ARUDO
MFSSPNPNLSPTSRHLRHQEQLLPPPPPNPSLQESGFQLVQALAPPKPQQCRTFSTASSSKNRFFRLHSGSRAVRSFPDRIPAPEPKNHLFDRRRRRGALTTPNNRRSRNGGGDVGSEGVGGEGEVEQAAVAEGE